MAKKSTARSEEPAHQPEPAEEELHEEGLDDDAVEPSDDDPAVKAAAEAVRRAENELAKAHAYYRELREQAVEHVEQIRDSQVGDLIDTTLRWVRKHPGGGVMIAGFLGFFLGRLFRR